MEKLGQGDQSCYLKNGRSLQQALNHALDMQLLQVHVRLAAAHKHDWRTGGVHHAQRGAHLRAAAAWDRRWSAVLLHQGIMHFLSMLQHVRQPS